VHRQETIHTTVPLLYEGVGVWIYSAASIALVNTAELENRGGGARVTGREGIEIENVN